MIIGTRGSALALAQTTKVVGLIGERRPGLQVDLLKVATTGDNVTDRPLSALGGYGAFTKELDQRILSGEIDVAVNSLKDMPVDLTPGTSLAAVLPRGPVEDVLVGPCSLAELPRGAVVGTSSVRRASLIRYHRPDLVVKDLRGNVPTRLRKLSEGMYDAIVLARAGIERLGLEQEYHILDPNVFVPAVGQGAIALVCLEGGQFTETLGALNDPVTRLEVDAERFIMRALGGGCSVPIGVWAKVSGDRLRVRGSIVAQGNDRTIEVERTVSISSFDEGLREVSAELSKGLEGGHCGQ